MACFGEIANFTLKTGEGYSVEVHTTDKNVPCCLEGGKVSYKSKRKIKGRIFHSTLLSDSERKWCISHHVKTSGNFESLQFRETFVQANDHVRVAGLVDIYCHGTTRLIPAHQISNSTRNLGIRDTVTADVGIVVDVVSHSHLKAVESDSEVHEATGPCTGQLCINANSINTVNNNISRTIGSLLVVGGIAIAALGVVLGVTIVPIVPVTIVLVALGALIAIYGLGVLWKRGAIEWRPNNVTPELIHGEIGVVEGVVEAHVNPLTSELGNTQCIGYTCCVTTIERSIPQRRRNPLEGAIQMKHAMPAI